MHRSVSKRVHRLVASDGVGLEAACTQPRCSACDVVGSAVNDRQFPILMYHSISSNQSRQFQSFSVSPACFEEHLRYIRSEGYSPLTVSELVRALESPKPILPRRPIALTFDDGFADFYESALPILDRYGVTATLYGVGSSHDTRKSCIVPSPRNNVASVEINRRGNRYSPTTPTAGPDCEKARQDRRSPLRGPDAARRHCLAGDALSSGYRTARL